MSLNKNYPVIILSAGHGQGDPGATNETFREADQTIKMVDRITQNLRSKGLNIDIVPHGLGLVNGIAWVNNKYKTTNSGWAIEIHRDSAPGIVDPDASKRCGVYGFGGDDLSMGIAEDLKDILVREGSTNVRTWARPDTVARHGRLGWIRDPKPLSHLFELGFMQGKNDDNHLMWLADLATKAIYEVYTGQKYESVTLTPPSEPIKLKPEDLIPNFRDLPEDYKNAVYNNDMPYMVARTTERDEEIKVGKATMEDLRNKVGQKNQEIGAKEKEIEELKLEIEKRIEENNNLQEKLNEANQQLLEKTKQLELAQIESSNEKVQNFAPLVTSQEVLDEPSLANAKVKEIFGTEIDFGKVSSFISDRLSKLTSTRFWLALSGIWTAERIGAPITVVITIVALLIITYIASETILKNRK